MTVEAGLRARILAAIRQTWPRRTGVSLWGRPASAASGPGHPDIGGVVRSRPIALEIKTAKGKPTPLQELRIRDLRDCGAYAWIVRSPAEGVQAVYWTAKGWTRPMSNEPLDLNAWLNSSPAQAPAPEFAPAAEVAPPQPVPAADPFEEPVRDFNLRVEPAVWDTPAHQEIAAQTLGFASAEQRQAVEHPEELSHPLQGATQESLLRLDRDVRTVGDRVSMIYERFDSYVAVLTAIDAKVSQLLGMIMEDPGTEPAPAPKRKRRSKAEIEAATAAPEPPNGAADLPDIVFDATPASDIPL